MDPVQAKAAAASNMPAAFRRPAVQAEAPQASAPALAPGPVNLMDPSVEVWQQDHIPAESEAPSGPMALMNVGPQVGAKGNSLNAHIRKKAEQILAAKRAAGTQANE